MTTVAPLFEKAQALDAFVDEWMQVERGHVSEQFLSHLTGSRLPTDADKDLFNGWTKTFHPTFSPLIVELFSALCTLNNRFFDLTKQLGLQFHGDQPLAPWGPLEVRDALRLAAHDSLTFMDASAWRHSSSAHLSSGTRRHHPLIQGMTAPLTLQDLALVSAMPSPKAHAQFQQLLGDQASAIINSNSLYLGAITKYTEAHNSLLVAVEQIGPYRDVAEVLNAFKDHILKHIDSRGDIRFLQSEVQMLASNYPVVPGALAQDGKCLFVKLADRKSIRFSFRSADWTNFHDLWLALPCNPDYGFSICTRTDLRDDEGTPRFSEADYCHPHVSQDGTLCLGDQTGFSTALWKTKSLSALAELCRNALHCYEHDSSYWKITGDEDEEEDEPYDYCRSCEESIWHEDDAHFIFDNSPRCLSCIRDRYGWCSRNEMYYPSNELMHVAHGPEENELMHISAYEEYVEEHPYPDEKSPDEELAEEQEEGKEEEEAPAPDANPVSEGEPALADRN